MRYILFPLLAFLSSTVSPQTLVPVAASGSTSPWLGVLVLAVVMVGGFFYLKKHNPAEVARISGQISAGEQAIVNAIHAHTAATVPAVVATEPVPAVPSPDALATVAAAQAALDAAKKAAGV